MNDRAAKVNTAQRLAYFYTSTECAACCRVTPPWLEAINAEPGVANGMSVQEALDMYAAIN